MMTLDRALNLREIARQSHKSQKPYDRLINQLVRKKLKAELKAKKDKRGPLL